MMTGSISPPAATVERAGLVGIITLNRPDALNAVNADLSTAVGAALEEMNADTSIRVAVVTGAGRAFCAGADLKALASGRSISARGRPEWGFAGLVEHPVDKPLIAAVNGFALGGGTEILLACDLAVLSEDAALGLPEVKRGLFAAAGGLIHLPRQLPVKVAMEMALTGDSMPAAEALRWGLVNRVVPKEQVLAEAVELAERIARNAPLSIRTSKKMIRSAIGAASDWDRQLWAQQDSQINVIFASQDAKEGATAFAEKREPAWMGS